MDGERALARKSLLAFFDLGSYPTGEEIFAFMRLADGARRNCNATSLHLVIVAEDVPSSEASARCANVGVERVASKISSCLTMMPSINGYTVCGSRLEACRILATWDGAVFPHDYACASLPRSLKERSRASAALFEQLDEQRRSDSLPPFAIVRQAAEYVHEWLKNIAGNRPLITLTLADTDTFEADDVVRPHRLCVVERFDADEHAVVLVAADTLTAVSLPERYRQVPIFPGASAFSPMRYALYERAHVNLLEIPESVGFYCACDSIPCVYFGGSFEAPWDIVAARHAVVPTYDPDAILDACRRVQSATAGCPVGRRHSGKASLTQAMSIDAFYERAIELHRTSGGISSAIKIFSGILKANPRHAGALGMLGAIAMALGEEEQALPLIAGAKALAPADPAHHYNLGNALMLLGRHDEAYAGYRAAVLIDSSLYDAWAGLASVYDERGDLELAAVCYCEASKQPTRSPSLLFEYAHCLQRLGRHEEAATLYQDASRRYLTHLEDEEAANAMSGLFRRMPFMARNASFLSE